MLTIRRRVGKDIMLLLASVTLFAGCAPPGARALLQGKKLLEKGQYQAAVEKLRSATLLLGNTNGQAFNYLGLACQQAGQSTEAERAYRRAIALDPNLPEARYNLGCLLLAENRLDQAKTELTAYALHRGNSVEAWLQLGTAQLRSREYGAAERSFGEALRFAPQDAEALTGVGVIRLQLHRSPREAADLFEKALKAQPDYAPALLNLAIVAQENLKDRALALRTYRAYLSLKPNRENEEGVKAIVHQLEQELAPPPRAVVISNPEPHQVASPSRGSAADPARTTAPPKTVVAELPRSAVPARLEHTNTPQKLVPATNAVHPVPAVVSAPQTNFELVKVSSEPVFKPAEDVVLMKSPPVDATPVESTISGPTSSPPAAPKPTKRGFFQKINPINLFSGDTKSSPPANEALPIRAAGLGDDSSAAVAIASNLPPNAVVRYAYRSSVPLESGDRPAAQSAFVQGLRADQARDLTAAVAAYRRSAEADPSYFDAQYNLGLAAFRQGNMPLSLAADENALAILPHSEEARYNFALALKQANYPVDAALQLEKLLSVYPNNGRAHLALANLYAQQLQQPGRARVHYKKVLEIDPRNPQAPAVRDWLTAHPK